jgi:hypothetical protein
MDTRTPKVIMHDPVLGSTHTVHGYPGHVRAAAVQLQQLVQEHICEHARSAVEGPPRDPCMHQRRSVMS